MRLFEYTISTFNFLSFVLEINDELGRLMSPCCCGDLVSLSCAFDASCLFAGEVTAASPCETKLRLSFAPLGMDAVLMFLFCAAVFVAAGTLVVSRTVRACAMLIGRFLSELDCDAVASDFSADCSAVVRGVS